jgi:hypothetical protein
MANKKGVARRLSYLGVEGETRGMEPEGDPRSLPRGSDERSRWFTEAREYLPDFDPMLVDPRTIPAGTIAWHIWCEQDACEEGLAEHEAYLQSDYIADYACHEPEKRPIRLSATVLRGPGFRTRRAKTRARRAA